MRPAQLRLANGYPSTTFQFASDTPAMRRTKFCPTTGNLLTTPKYTLLSTTVLDTKLGGRLSRLVATSHRTATATSMRGTEVGTTHCRLTAAFNLASFSTSMGRAKVLVAGSLVATGEFAPTTSTVGNAKTSGSLGALAATWMLAHAVPHVTGTIGLASDSRFVASLDAARL